MEYDLLTDEDLARRWKVELITICQWRWNGKGPRFFKMGRQIFYRPEDVRYFEEQKTKKARLIRVEKKVPHQSTNLKITRGKGDLNEHTTNITPAIVFADSHRCP